MKKFGLLLGIIILLSFGCKNDKATQQKKSDEYVYDKYGFAIKFEHEPKKQESIVPTNIGDVTAVAIGDDQGTEAYIVYVNIYPDKYKEQVNASESIKKQILETAKNMKLTVVEEKENNFENKPSYYIYAENLEDSLYAVMQGIASGTHVYIIAALAQGENGDQIVDSRGQDFIKSFRLLEN
jgi:hypothetical protein